MTLEELTGVVKKSAEKASAIGKTIKLELDLGTVFVDLTQEPVAVSNDDRDADATVTTTVEVLEKLSKGEMNPMMAVMSGKIKIKGDMGVAMKLQSLLS